MKKSIFLFFAAILCSVSAWAYNVPAGYYIYFEKPSAWTQACLLIGKSDYSEGRKMTTISNTNLYYWKTVKWDGYTEYFFMQDEWGGEGSSPTHRNQYAGSNKTAVFKTQFKNYHLFTTDGSKLNSTSSYSVINKTQTIKVQLKDGSNWVDATVVPADLTASTYALTSETAAGAKSASLAKESTTVSATVSAAYSAKVTLSCTNVLDGYVFEGWYDANGNKITSYTVSDAHTVYARFIQSAEETNEVTVTYMCGTTSVATAIAEFVGVETEKSFTAPTVTGYNFTGWTVGAGMTLKAGTENDATITVVTKSSSSNYTLVANYEEVLETIYFINTGNWSVVNLHRWNGTAAATSWPGEAMTSTGEKIGEYDVYSFTAQQGAFANVIFTNKNTGTDQTDDLTWTAGKYYIYNHGGKSGWYTKAEAEELLVVPVVTHDIVVKAVVPAAWTSTTIGIHYWGEGISGTSNPVATEKDGNWNKYTIKNVPEGVSVNVIFLNGTSWTDDKSKQTANITDITEDKCFQISATKLDSEGKCTVKEVDCDATIEPEVDVYTVVGSSDALGLAWDPAKEANDMEKQGDGSYKKVYSNVELTSDVEWKIAKNDNWWNETPLENKADNGNSVLVIAKSGIYNVTFTLSADLKTAHAEAELLEETNTVADCYISGNTALTGGAGWAGNEFKMEYTEATETYSYTLTGLAAETAYELKVVLGGTWHGFSELVDPAPANVTEGNDNSIAFTLATAGDVTVTYHATNGIGLTGNFAAPAPEAKKYYVKGTHNEWTADATSEMTLDGEVYKKEVTLAKDVEFKINDGADAWWGKDNLGGKSYNELEGLESGNLKMLEEKTFTIIFNPAEHLITFEGLTEIIPTYTVAGNNAAVFGTEWDAENYDNNMTLQDHDGTYVWTKPAVYLAGNVEFKVIKNQNWETAWPSDNYVIDITESAFYSLTIYYNPTNNDITVLTDKLTAQTGSLTLEGVMLEEVDFGGMTLLSLVGHTNDWTSDVNIYLENYTGDNKAYDVYIESAITYNENYSMNQAVSGQLTQTTGADGLRTFTGTLNVAFEGYDIETDESVVLPYQLTLTLVEKSDAATVVVVTDATVTLDAGLTMTGTWTDLGTTYPVLVTVPGFDPSVASAELEAAITVGGEGEFDPWLGFVEGLTTVTVEDGVVEVTGVLENTWAGVKLDVTISGTLPVVPAPEKYTRTVTPGYFGTICLPYGSEDMTGATFFETSHIEGDKVYFNEVTTLVAGHAYIFLASATEIAVVSDGTEVATPEVVNGLHGTFDYIDDVANVSLETEEYIIVYNSTTSQCELSKCGEDCTLEANRAYVVLSEIGTVPVQLMPGCRRIGMSVQGENEATGFENITAPEGQTIKAIVNGQLIIIRNGEKFNAQGVRL